MEIPILDATQIVEKLQAQINPYFEEYYAFYSSWFGGIIKNPSMMLIPIDDHMVHRGDGVFEAMKAVGRSVYLMDEHLQRLFVSAEKIALQSPVTLEQMKDIVLETLRVANHNEASIRIFFSRGPGNFTVNPYDSIAAQLYVIISKLTPPSENKYKKGVTIGRSSIPIKSSWMSQVKSCNYLPNVLMKKEAVDRGLDYVIGIDTNGCITESATENILIVNQSGSIIHPTFDHILKGTTMLRTCELARENGTSTESKSISIEDLQNAREVLITGTSLNVLPVVEFEGCKIGNGQPGPIAKQLNDLLLNDIEQGIKSIPF